MTVTAHAIKRYQERVANISDDAARDALSTRFIRQAIAFGAGTVILSGGQKVVIEGGNIVTVLPKDSRGKATLRRRPTLARGDERIM